jgi:hypothetical protein
MQKRILSIKTAVAALVREIPIRIKAVVVGLKSKLPGTASVVALVRGVPVRIKTVVVSLKSKLPGTASVVALVREVTFYEQLKKATQLSKPHNDESKKLKLKETASKPKIPKTNHVVGSKRKLSKTTLVVLALVVIGLALSVTTFAVITNSPIPSSADIVKTLPNVSNSPATQSPNVANSLSSKSNVLSNGAVTTSANCGLYSDSACTTPLSSIDWGVLTAGGTVTQTIYVKNTGSGLPLTLNMTTTNWSPASANGPITVTWDQEGTILSPGQSIAATLTLAVSSSEIGLTNFGVQISITGTNS